MRILEVLNSKWMIQEGLLSIYQVDYLNHLNGPKLDFKKDLRAEAQSSIQVIGKTAIIDINGPITPKISYFSYYYQSASYEQITIQLNEAIARADVENIVFRMNTPGGTVEGAFELAALVKEHSKTKKISTFSEGMFASAGMLLASATDERVISSGTVEAGSIGVIARKMDVTKMMDEWGIKFHEFVSGKYKNVFSENKKLTEDDGAFIQSQVDFLFSMFVNLASENLGMPVEQIAEMEGATFIGQQAIDNGLVDRIGVLDDLIIHKSSLSNFNRGNIMNEGDDKGLQFSGLTTDMIKTNCPAIFAEIHKSGMIAGQQRVLMIQDAAFDGQEDLAKSCIADLTLDAGMAAIKFNEAMKASTLAAGAQAASEMPEAVVVVENATPEAEAASTEKDPVLEYETAVAAAEATGISKGKAMGVVKKANPKVHAAYIEAVNKK